MGLLLFAYSLSASLTCLIFLKASRWLVWTFFAQSHLNFLMNLIKVKIRKEHKKHVAAHQSILSEIFHDPCKNLPVSPYILNVRSLLHYP